MSIDLKDNDPMRSKAVLPIAEGKCPPEINPETGEWYYPEPGKKRTAKRMVCGIDVDEVLHGLQCCKTYGECGKCPYKDNSKEGCNRNRLMRESYTVIDKMTETIYRYREAMHDISEILDRT